ncbi:Uncharacterised protein [Serratia quinivorans]|nr:Uncharacterised protein [Serratia quinivorans]
MIVFVLIVKYKDVLGFNSLHALLLTLAFTSFKHFLAFSTRCYSWQSVPPLFRNWSTAELTVIQGRCCCWFETALFNHFLQTLLIEFLVAINFVRHIMSSCLSFPARKM